MTHFLPKRLLPAATLIAASFFIADALAHVVVPVVAHAVAVRPVAFDVLQAEIDDCRLRSGRTHDECADEVEGKALIRQAESLAELEATQGSDRNASGRAQGATPESRLQ